MDIFLLPGAHRTGTASLHSYLRDSRAALAEDGTAVWPVQAAHGGAFSGLFDRERRRNGRNLQRRAMGRLRLHAAQAGRAGARRLVIAQTGALGTAESCLRRGALYPAAGERLARLGTAFDGRIRRVVLTIRAQDLWWTSLMADRLRRGGPLPPNARLGAIAGATRSWRDVISDLACALPAAELIVTPFERAAGQGKHLLELATQRSAPPPVAEHWLNRSSDRLSRERSPCGAEGGRWTPFTPAQKAALRGAYAEDLTWLAAGADGLARLTEETTAQPQAGPAARGPDRRTRA